MKYVTSFIGAAALAVASYGVEASPVTAGGVTWDPIDNGGIGGAFQFQQWYTDASNYTVDSNGVTKLANGNAVAPGLGLLSGVGIFNQIFDSRTLFGNLGFPSEFGYCTSCVLSFSFGGLSISDVTPTSVGFDTSNSWLNIYYQNPINVLGVSTTAYENVNSYQNGTLWASLKFDSFWLNGTILGGSVQSTLSVVGGLPDVVEALDRNVGVSDIFLQGIAQFEQGRLYSGSSTGPAAGQFATIPEPVSIALLGLGLLGLAGSRRYKKA
jgi:hypothetical protein